MRRFLVVAGLTLAAATPTVVPVRPLFATEAVGNDPDDPAVWVDARAPQRSLILGTNKVAAPQGALVVFDRQGRTLQTINGLDRPNNVDVTYGFALAGARADIAVLTERNRSRLRAFRIDPATRRLSDVSGRLDVFAGETGRRNQPMGIALYRRPGDGAQFAIVGRKDGPKAGYLWQYRLRDEGDGKVSATLVRQFGEFGGTEIEAIAVDAELGFVYYSDERYGVHKWHADPDHPQADREVRLFAQDFVAQQEGIAIYPEPRGKGYVIVTDQQPVAQYRVYTRDTNELVGVFSGGADTTDGIEAVGAPLHLFVAMNSGPKNFLVYDWRAIKRALRLP